ncbi:hypothetical protein E5F05_04305 (plasmid) [Deinococcus metallilatus]|uniref:Uncharacterized protein n=1 Tax=Deinococcus metallilatus TaxID=1211322 RepID=A0AAJ5K119_9DEIO|nr:hypothetical protein [Deinococcus metallilatus]MBB5293838.1 hypothetical protein [Deinococcus metallilatus]QBY07210.1 hypothetical protein E5F05_04305 [Deinococcus metallilatus]RXJ14682.1 hypothetical protein ERJ73_03035 [Deinococcus metallilatus]TLK30802.1 hypothetical protein FCS05_03350 [Deinococcus metallilatus]GMA17770.1 hypothetical protein GCM10025871_41010 [Deinococcus metallilatus]
MPSSPLSAVADLLSQVPVHYAHSRFGPAPIHVLGKGGSSLTRLDVYVREDDLCEFVRELPLHAAVPALWTVWLQRRAPLPLDWAWGFLEAQRQCFPRGGVYRPSRALEPSQHCEASDPAVMDARRLGMLAYLLCLASAEEHFTIPNAAD